MVLMKLKLLDLRLQMLLIVFSQLAPLLKFKIKNLVNIILFYKNFSLFHASITPGLITILSSSAWLHKENTVKDFEVSEISSEMSPERFR